MALTIWGKIKEEVKKGTSREKLRNEYFLNLVDQDDIEEILDIFYGSANQNVIKRYSYARKLNTFLALFPFSLIFIFLNNYLGILSVIFFTIYWILFLIIGIWSLVTGINVAGSTPRAFWQILPGSMNKNHMKWIRLGAFVIILIGITILTLTIYATNRIRIYR